MAEQQKVIKNPQNENNRNVSSQQQPQQPQQSSQRTQTTQDDPGTLNSPAVVLRHPPQGSRCAVSRRNEVSSKQSTSEKERVSDEWDPNSRTPSYPDFSQQARNKSLRTYSCPYILEQKVAIMLRCISDQFCAQHWMNNAAALEYNETRRRRSCSLTVENKVRQGRMLDDPLLQQHLGQMNRQKRRGSGRRRDIATPLPSTFNIDDNDFNDEDDDDESPNLQNLKIYKMLVEEFSGEGSPVDTDVSADVPQPTTAISSAMQQPSIPTFSSSPTVSPSSSQSYLEMKSSIDECQRSVAPETLEMDATECHWTSSSSSSFFSSLATSFPAVNMPSSSSSQSKSSSPVLTSSSQKPSPPAKVQTKTQPTPPSSPFPPSSLLPPHSSSSSSSSPTLRNNF